MPSKLAELMTGGSKSVLLTDGYKFSMAQAGYPLRQETFYLTFRKGGPFYIPFDLKSVIEALRPEPPTVKEAGFLTTHGYGLTPAMEKALEGGLEIWCPPRGSWVGAREPIATITGPSFLVSWLEPLMIMLQYPIQIATALKEGWRKFTVTCEVEAAIVKHISCFIGDSCLDVEVKVCRRDYRKQVKQRVMAIIEAVDREPWRLFEVGLRGATCYEQHKIVLKIARRKNLLKTSNVKGAYDLYMQPVGTTGHEHQQRHGTDLEGFRAIRDTRPEMPSYLFDTYDPMNEGIPAVYQAVNEDPRPFTVRFDSGDQDEQFRKLEAMAWPKGQVPTYIFEDSYTAGKTAANEKMLETYGVPKERRWYGYGGYLVSQPSFTDLTRDKVSAAYKLTQSAGIPVMKFSGSPGKESTPGKPVILRRTEEARRTLKVPPKDFPLQCDSAIGQMSEEPPEGWVVLEDEAGPRPYGWGDKPEDLRVESSPATRKLVNQCSIRHGKIPPFPEEN